MGKEQFEVTGTVKKLKSAAKETRRSGQRDNFLLELKDGRKVRVLISKVPAPKLKTLSNGDPLRVICRPVKLLKGGSGLEAVRVL